MTMLKITVGTNSSRREVIVSSEDTVRKILTDNGVKYESAQVHIDGAPCMPGDLNRTLPDFGITPAADGGSSCYIIAVVKADSAR